MSEGRGLLNRITSFLLRLLAQKDKVHVGQPVGGATETAGGTEGRVLRTPERLQNRTVRIHQQGIDLIKKFEGCKLGAYQDSVGIWTIGYGHIEGVKQGDVITQTEADAFLEKDIQVKEKEITPLIKVEVNENQWAALVSFAFNLGAGNLAKSTLLSRLNSKDFASAGEEFLKWNKAGGKPLNGLTYRRQAERSLFLTPVV
jgi:lysozyme